MVISICNNSSINTIKTNSDVNKENVLIINPKLQNSNVNYFTSFQQAQALRNQILFTADSDKNTNNLKVAQTGLFEINKMLERENIDEPFNYPEWYINLRGTLFKDYDESAKACNNCPTTKLDNIFCANSKEDIKLIRDSLQAMIGATMYSPKFKQDIPVPIHNQLLLDKIIPNYTSSSFKKLFNYCDKENHIFDLKFVKGDSSGIPQTSVINRDEDPKMSENRWVTDTCRNIEIMKDKCPTNCYKALQTLSSYYKKQDDVFRTIIDDPRKYEEGYGLGHVFNITTLETHGDYPKTRLESTGIYLSTLCDITIGELVGNTNYGLKTTRENNNEIVHSIVNIVKYLEAIDYSQAPSCGNWEEGTFYGGLTSDTEIVNNGLRKVRNLLYSDKYNSNDEILKLREDVFKDELSGGKENFKNTLDMIIEKGEKRVKESYLQEAKDRKADASLAFVTHTAKLDDDLIKDVEKNIEILELLDKELVGNNGIRRYNDDRYKCLNYDIAVNSNGEIIDSNNNKTCQNEAQWFMVSDISKGYGMQLKKLLDKIEQEGRQPSKEEIKLIKLTFQKETEFINRSYARITGMDKTGKPNIKANGKACPAFTLPEAYQSISTLHLANSHTLIGINKKEKKATYVPGTNTPLAWAQSSLYDASKLFLENLEMLERLNSKKIINLPQLKGNKTHPDTKHLIAASIYI